VSSTADRSDPPNRGADRADGKGPIRRWALPAVLVCGAIVLAGCSSRGGAPKGVTEQSDNFSRLWTIFLVGAALVAGLIWILVLVSIVRFRRRSDDEMPSQKQYNIPAEIAYLAVPILIVAFLFGITVVATDGFTSLKDKPDLTVDVVGFQWQWQFEYPDQHIVLNGGQDGNPTLVLPVGETIRFNLSSNDVNHSFWVPEFLEKRDLIPGVDNSIEVKITEPGEWTGRCAEYCGLDHWKMTFTVKAIPQDEFDQWVAETAAKPQPVLDQTTDGSSGTGETATEGGPGS
jgi:cytochrome c oxidase subunit II